MTPESTAAETPAECPSCHTPEGRPHTDYCRAVAPAEYPPASPTAAPTPIQPTALSADTLTGQIAPTPNTNAL